MKKPDEERRLYRSQDLKAIEASKTKRELFNEDKGDFVSFDNDFADPFTQEWQAENEAAEEVAKHDTVLSRQTSLTDNVNNKMDDCKNIVQESKYHVEKAFADKPVIFKEFGYKGYSTASKSQVGMIDFMKNFSRAVTKHSCKLIEVGMKEENINLIQQLPSALDEANIAQETFMDKIPVLTQERIRIMNKPWLRVLAVCKAAKNIYKNDAAKLKQYEAPHPDNSPDNSNTSDE